MSQGAVGVQKLPLTATTPGAILLEGDAVGGSVETVGDNVGVTVVGAVGCGLNVGAIDGDDDGSVVGMVAIGGMVVPSGTQRVPLVDQSCSPGSDGTNSYIETVPRSHSTPRKYCPSGFELSIFQTLLPLGSSGVPLNVSKSPFPSSVQTFQNYDQ